MFLYFKDLRLHFVLASLAGSVILIILAVFIMRLFFVPLAACVLVGFSYALLWTIFRRTLAEKKAVARFAHVHHLLNDECQVSHYVKFYEYLLAENRDPHLRRRLLVNLSTGYLEQGKDLKAKDLLEPLTAYFFAHHTNVNKLMFCNNMTRYYLDARDLENAEKMLKIYKAVLDDPALSKALRESHLTMYEDKEATFYLLKGHAKEVEAFYQEFLDDDHTQLEKVHAQEKLAIIYRQTNRPDLALAAKMYLIKNGGDTNAARQARLEFNNAGKTD